MAPVSLAIPIIDLVSIFHGAGRCNIPFYPPLHPSSPFLHSLPDRRETNYARDHASKLNASKKAHPLASDRAANKLPLTRRRNILRYRWMASLESTFSYHFQNFGPAQSKTILSVNDSVAKEEGSTSDSRRFSFFPRQKSERPSKAKRPINSTKKPAVRWRINHPWLGEL